MNIVDIYHKIRNGAENLFGPDNRPAMVECTVSGNLGDVEFLRGEKLAICGDNNGVNIKVDDSIMICHCYGNSLIPVEFRDVEYSPNSEPLPEFEYL